MFLWNTFIKTAVFEVNFSLVKVSVEAGSSFLPCGRHKALPVTSSQNQVSQRGLQLFRGQFNQGSTLDDSKWCN